ncbi:MAG: LacI family transcriptional regulator [Phycisphaerae bacterium]|nr:LacI family transcriptional regulator [Phycisphaerae bacterium]
MKAMNRNRVAELAGVSPITVSRVFRGSGLVAEATRQRVIEAGRRCGYYPHAGARAMRCGRFNRIAACVVQYGPKGSVYSPNNGYLDAATDELAEHGYSLVFEPLHLAEAGDEFIEPPRLFSETAVDGVLGLPTGGLAPKEVDDHLARLGAPVVWMNRNPGECPVSVVCDEYRHGRMLARHLIDLGHRRIAYAGYGSPHYSATGRFAGIRDELVAGGLDTSALYLGPRPPQPTAMAERILDLSEPVTAVIAYHRGFQEGMLRAASLRGLNVPRDLSVCHFASAWEFELVDRPPTAVSLPEPQVAVAAVRALVELMDGKLPEIPAPVVGELVVGFTSAEPGKR